MANGQQTQLNKPAEPALQGGTADPVPASQSARKRPSSGRGRFLPGNAAALRHGRYSKAVAAALLPEQQQQLDRLAEYEAAIFADLGGAADLSTFQRDLVAKFQQLGNLADYSAARVASMRAAVRREATAVFFSAIDRQLKIIALLGVSRRSRPIPLTPREWLMRAGTDPLDVTTDDDRQHDRTPARRDD